MTQYYRIKSVMSFHVHFGWPLGHTWPNLLFRNFAKDPTRQTYGPQMREKVNLLAERWASVRAQEILNVCQWMNQGMSQCT